MLLPVGSPCALPRRLLVLFVMAAALGLAGYAGPQPLRLQYVERAEAQAQVGNQLTQQLTQLNLAHIRNGHPPYFLRLARITPNERGRAALQHLNTREDTILCMAATAHLAALPSQVCSPFSHQPS